jgi:PBSX family phage portal protein
MRKFLSRIINGIRKQSEGTGLLARFKSHVVGEGLETNTLAPDDAGLQEFADAGALNPPLPFEQLVTLLFASNSLRQNVDAMVTNVYGFGWRPVPTIDIHGENRAEVVQEFHRMRGEEIDDERAKQLADEWRTEAERERDRMQHFFEFINPEITWDQFRAIYGQDREVLGNSAYEVLRDKAGRPARFTNVPFATVRLLPLDKQFTTIEIHQKVDPVTIKTVKVRRRLRRMVQVQEQLAVYFKEYGDPRVFSSKTGEHYENVEALEEKEPGIPPATEMIHSKLHAPNQAYGMPRYVGVLPEVIGSRMAAEVNVNYFENKSVPPMVMLVNGGRVTGDSVSRIESFIQNNIKGTENFHNILIIEAEPEGDNKTAGKAQIKLQPLTEAMNQDALFQRYDQRNIDKVGAAFRIPGMLRGDIKELNRATAETAKSMAEEQVFQPERDAFDSMINRKILPALGIKFWEYKSRAAGTRDPGSIATIIGQLVTNNVLMPGEARAFVPEILGEELPKREDDFLDKPPRIVLAEIRAEASSGRLADEDEQPPPEAPPEGDEPEAGEQPGEMNAPVDEGADENGNGVAKTRTQRLKDLVPMARDAVALRRLIESIELGEDLDGMDPTELRRLIQHDGSVDEDVLHAK